MLMLLVLLVVVVAMMAMASTLHNDNFWLWLAGNHKTLGASLLHHWLLHAWLHHHWLLHAWLHHHWLLHAGLHHGLLHAGLHHGLLHAWLHHSWLHHTWLLHTGLHHSWLLHHWLHSWLHTGLHHTWLLHTGLHHRLHSWLHHRLHAWLHHRLHAWLHHARLHHTWLHTWLHHLRLLLLSGTSCRLSCRREFTLEMNLARASTSVSDLEPIIDSVVCTKGGKFYDSDTNLIIRAGILVVNLQLHIVADILDIDLECLIPHGSLACAILRSGFEVLLASLYFDIGVHLAEGLRIAR